LEDVLVDGFRTYAQPPFFAWGAVFKHVTLKGNIDYIVLNAKVTNWLMKPALQPIWDKANAAYYANVDWALNVREARFKECDIRSVPARLIMRDPDTQAVVNRESALKVEWKRDATNGWKAVRVGNRVLDLSKTWWPSMIQFMLDDGRHDIVLIAPTRNPKFRELLDGIKMLRDVGVAEPN